MSLPAGVEADAEAAAKVDRNILTAALKVYVEAGKTLSHASQQNHAAAPDEVTLKLPIIFGTEMQPVEIHISRDSDDEPGTATRDGWQLRFNMYFSQLGHVGSHMRLFANRLSLTLWADRPEIAEALRGAAGDLSAAFADGNVSLASLAIHEGDPDALADEPFWPGMEVEAS